MIETFLSALTATREPIFWNLSDPLYDYPHALGYRVFSNMSCPCLNLLFELSWIVKRPKFSTIYIGKLCYYEPYKS
jgi:hypothetical protein